MSLSFVFWQFIIIVYFGLNLVDLPNNNIKFSSFICFFDFLPEHSFVSFFLSVVGDGWWCCWCPEKYVFLSGCVCVCHVCWVIFFGLVLFWISWPWHQSTHSTLTLIWVSSFVHFVPLFVNEGNWLFSVLFLSVEIIFFIRIEILFYPRHIRIFEVSVFQDLYEFVISVIPLPFRMPLFWFTLFLRF